jgi:hypothetical protein
VLENLMGMNNVERLGLEATVSEVTSEELGVHYSRVHCVRPSLVHHGSCHIDADHPTRCDATSEIHGERARAATNVQHSLTSGQKGKEVGRGIDCCPPAV